MDIGASALLAGYALGALLFGGAYLVAMWRTSCGPGDMSVRGADGSESVRSDLIREVAFVGFGWGLWLTLAVVVALFASVALLAHGLVVLFNRVWRLRVLGT